MSKSIISAGGKHLAVNKGDIVDVDLNKDDISENSTVSFDVLMLNEGEKTVVGTPIVENCKAVCKVVGIVKGPKGITYKYKRRKGYSRKVGFRQHYVRVIVESFSNVNVVESKTE